MAKQNKQKLQIKLLKIIASSLIFVLIWVLFQAPYVFDFDFFGIRLSESDNMNFFILYSIWTCLLSLPIAIIWKINVNNFSFLKLKNKKWLLLYLIPVILSAILIAKGNDLFGVNPVIYIIFISLATFFGQDLTTFGYYQQYLEDNANKKIAAIVVTICFFLSHFIFWTPSIADLPLIAVYLIGFIIFSWSRYKTGNIYILNVIHLSFGLVMSLI